MRALAAKLLLWKSRVASENYANFQLVEDALQQSKSKMPKVLQEEISDHLQMLILSFENYFDSRDDPHVNSWVRNPFIFDINSLPDSNLFKDELIDLQSLEVLHHEFKLKKIGDFWCSARTVCPKAAEYAIRMIIPFTTTYLCESGFSTLVTIKSNSRNRLQASDDMRVALSSTLPNFRELVDKKQEQKSH